MERKETWNEKIAGVDVLYFVLCGCSAGYVMSELKGTAKPEGGIQEQIPVSKTYKAGYSKVWKAVQDVLEDQGYMFSVDTASGRIKTEPKIIGNPNEVAVAGASYSAVVSIKVERSTVSYRARFNKQSNLVQPEELREFPEKENELRKEFFAALDAKVK